ncbi:hypothetical protein EDB85DRAFT_1901069 [Lactarius pseudohatsudake]|nr:hypothetical protein EDB85DRAFT_1901069 [Lactarius pseudohatsudake]
MPAGVISFESVLMMRGIGVVGAVWRARMMAYVNVLQGKIQRRDPTTYRRPATDPACLFLEQAPSVYTTSSNTVDKENPVGFDGPAVALSGALGVRATGVGAIVDEECDWSVTLSLSTGLISDSMGSGVRCSPLRVFRAHTVTSSLGFTVEEMYSSPIRFHFELMPGIIPRMSGIARCRFQRCAHGCVLPIRLPLTRSAHDASGRVSGIGNTISGEPVPPNNIVPIISGILAGNVILYASGLAQLPPGCLCFHTRGFIMFKSPGALLRTAFTTIPCLNRTDFETLRASFVVVSTTELSDDRTGRCGAARAAPQIEEEVDSGWTGSEGALKRMKVEGRVSEVTPASEEVIDVVIRRVDSAVLLARLQRGKSAVHTVVSGHQSSAIPAWAQAHPGSSGRVEAGHMPGSRDGRTSGPIPKAPGSGSEAGREIDRSPDIPLLRYALGLLLLPILSPVCVVLLRLASPTKRLQTEADGNADRDGGR